MLRVSIHSALPSQVSRFNRTDWIDIGYQTLASHAEHKIVLFEAGRGAREPVRLRAYPRWSSSLWDLAARAIALAYWSAPLAGESVYATMGPAAIDQDGDAVPVDNLPPPTPPRRPPREVHASQVELPPAEDVGPRCAFATVTTATISHFTSSGVGGRRLGTLLIAHDKKVRGQYGAHVNEDPLAGRLIKPFIFSPPRLSPAELVCRTACHILAGSINALPPCPALQVPPGEIIDGVETIKVHHLDEPARSGFLRWLMKQGRAPQPEKGAALGRVPSAFYRDFLQRAI